MFLCDFRIYFHLSFPELTEIELKLGPLGLYIEDAYVGAAVELYRLAVPPTAQTSEVIAITEINNLQNPLRLRKLHIHPLDLTLTLHTAVCITFFGITVMFEIYNIIYNI